MSSTPQRKRKERDEDNSTPNKYSITESNTPCPKHPTLNLFKMQRGEELVMQCRMPNCVVGRPLPIGVSPVCKACANQITPGSWAFQVQKGCKVCYKCLPLPLLTTFSLCRAKKTSKCEACKQNIKENDILHRHPGYDAWICVTCPTMPSEESMENQMYLAAQLQSLKDFDAM